MSKAVPLPNSSPNSGADAYETGRPGDTFSGSQLPKYLGVESHLEVPPVGVRIVGSATDLFLALMRRRIAENAGCWVVGDPAAWMTLLERTPNAAPGTQ
jgi:hypothetical protein